MVCTFAGRRTPGPSFWLMVSATLVGTAAAGFMFPRAVLLAPLLIVHFGFGLSIFLIVILELPAGIARRES